MAVARERRAPVSAVLKKSRRPVFRGRFLAVRSAANGLGFNRLAVIVPMAVAGKAVRRNYLKRRVLAELSKTAPVGRDIAVLLSVPVGREDVGEMISEIGEARKRLENR